jgi:hypothetical protein
VPPKRNFLHARDASRRRALFIEFTFLLRF